MSFRQLLGSSQKNEALATIRAPRFFTLSKVTFGDSPNRRFWLLLLREAYLITKLQNIIEIHTIRQHKKAKQSNGNVLCLANQSYVEEYLALD